MTSEREGNEFVVFAVAFYLTVSPAIHFPKPKIFMNLFELSPERKPQRKPASQALSNKKNQTGYTHTVQERDWKQKNDERKKQAGKKG